MRFFHYSQNNSGGSFDFSDDPAITHHVIIEAKDAADADVRAIQIGLYFDGCSDGRDCSCCGDRWSNAYGEGDESPMIYGDPADKVKGRPWMAPGKEIAVHYADGRIVWHGLAKETP